MESKYKRLLKNSLFIMVGGSLSKVISLLMLPFYTHWLSVEDFGVSDIITVYASLCVGFSTLCVAESIFVFAKGADFDSQKRYFSSSLYFTILLLIGVALIFLLLSWMARCYGLTNSFLSYIWYIYAIIVTTFLQTFTHQFACAINAMKVYSFTGLVYAITLSVTAFIWVPIYKVEGYIFSMVLANVVAVGYTFVATKSHRYLSIHAINIDCFKEQIRYSIPLIPNSLMFWIVSSLNRPFLESYVGVAAIGLLAVANKFASILSMIFQYFAQSWQVAVFEEVYKTGFSFFFNRVMKLVFMLLMFVACCITLFSRQILEIITSTGYYAAAIYLGPLCFATVVGVMGSMIGSIFAVYKQSKYFFYTSVVGALTSFFLNMSFVPIWGIWGAVFASIISYLSIYLSRLLFAKRYVQITNLSFYLFVTVGFAVLVLLNCFLFVFWLKLLVVCLTFGLCLLQSDVRAGVVSVINIVKRKSVA